jgi:hypothetical protein
MNQPLIVLRDSDIFPEGFVFREKWNRPRERIAARSIVFDAEKKLPLQALSFGFFLAVE